MEGALLVVNEEQDLKNLPPGFRFHPTDEEIITHYLTNKVIDESFIAIPIEEVDINKCEPWNLAKRAKKGEKETFFFCQRDRKYPTGMRTNRATKSGYWKATGKDKEIYKDKTCLVGMKKTLVFYKGRAPKGEKTNWVMHEYRLDGRTSYYNCPRGAKDEWVICRVFYRNSGTFITRNLFLDLARKDSLIDHILNNPTTLPSLMEDLPSSSTDNPSSTVTHRDTSYEIEDQPGNITTYLYDFQNSYQATNMIHAYTHQEYPNSGVYIANHPSHVDTETGGKRTVEEIEGVLLSADHNVRELDKVLKMCETRSSRTSTVHYVNI